MNTPDNLQVIFLFHETSCYSNFVLILTDGLVSRFYQGVLIFVMSGTSLNFREEFTSVRVHDVSKPPSKLRHTKYMISFFPFCRNHSTLLPFIIEFLKKYLLLFTNITDYFYTPCISYLKTICCSCCYSS